MRYFLGENFGFLHWQRIQVAFWGVRTNPWTDFARLIKDHLGIAVRIPAVQLAEWEDQLTEAVRGKDERIGEAFRKKRAAYRAKVECFATTGKEGLAYRSGGTEGALQADLVGERAEAEQARFLGLEELDSEELQEIANGENGEDPMEFEPRGSDGRRRRKRCLGRVL